MRFQWLLCGAVAGGVLVAPLSVSVARAQAAATDYQVDYEVLLRDGSAYSGELVELLVGYHIVLKLSTGELKRIEWDQIQQHHPIAPAPPAPPAPPVPPAPPALPAPSAPVAAPPPPSLPPPLPIPPQVEPSEQPYMVRARVVSEEREVRLYRLTDSADRESTDEKWRALCTSPCSATLDRRWEYEVRGAGAPERSFLLPRDGSSSLLVRVRPGHSSWRGAGIALTSLGGVLMLSGLGGFAFGYADTHTQQAFESTPGNPAPFYFAGAVALTLGVSGLGVGISLLVRSGTRISISED